jgi:flagellar biosynthesis regulator FlbT
MCLFSSQKMPLIADKNILCYKILVLDKNQLRTPYRDFIFQTNVLIVDSAEEHVGELFGMSEVTSGFFHTLATKEEVLKEVGTLQRKLPKGSKLKVFKAVIPKGYEYYVGQRSDMCSKALIIIE